MKKDRCAYCKEKGHWKIVFPKLNKKKELKLKAKLAQVVSTPDDSTSQAGGLDLDSSGYSLFITPIICCLEKSKWILNTIATYHVCFRHERFASFKKLDGV